MPELPLVLLIGDSISMGYTPFAIDLMAGEAEVTHHEGNGGDSRNVRGKLDDWLAAVRNPSVIHFNCGLHDLKVDPATGDFQVPIEEYRDNLQAIAERLGRTGASLIWASSTPVIDEWHQARKEFNRHDEDVVRYNTAAAEVMAAAGITVNDLYALIAARDPKAMLSPDGVHYPDASYEIMAEAVADAVRERLPKTP